MQDLILKSSITRIAGNTFVHFMLLLKVVNDWAEVVDALRRFHSGIVDGKKKIEYNCDLHSIIW